MLATIPSATVLGVEGRPVTVEVHVSSGVPAFTIVGLPDEACREARDRVRAAVLSAGLTWPLKRITVNLAPTGVRKGGAGLDLAIAVGVLVADETLAGELVRDVAFIGELGLDGAIRRVPGMVPLAAAIEATCVVVPAECVTEAALVAAGAVRAATDLASLVGALTGRCPWPDPSPVRIDDADDRTGDLAEIRGQLWGRHAIELAAAGGHHLLMVGPPGSGKTMLATRLAGLLPRLDEADALEATVVHSACGLPLPASGLVRHPPFRSPHHSASMVALVGGGSGTVRPGEISLAHGGVLFLDELAEFSSVVLDALRQPLEEGVVRVVRSRASVTFPARFLLVAAMNPCPCGAPQGPASCRCSDAARQRYARRLSGPLLDRFDLRVEVLRPDVDDLLTGTPGEATASVAARITAARSLARARGVRTNAEIPAGRLDELAPLTRAASGLLRTELRRGALSARGLHRVRRVARTVADLGGADGSLDEEHVSTALMLRADASLLLPRVA